MSSIGSDTRRLLPGRRDPRFGLGFDGLRLGGASDSRYTRLSSRT